MNRHKLGTTLGTMHAICDLLQVGIDPVSTAVEYETVGDDLNGVPIESGFGVATWEWDVLAQEDFDNLLTMQGDVAGATMYVHTSKHDGASGIEFANYACIAKRPTFERREGLLCYGVKIEFVQMV